MQEQRISQCWFCEAKSFEFVTLSAEITIYIFPNKHEIPFGYEYHGDEKCDIINIAMDESGSMVTEQQFMRDRAVKKIVRILGDNKHQFDKVFVFSNGFGNNPGGNPDADPASWMFVGVQSNHFAVELLELLERGT